MYHKRYSLFNCEYHNTADDEIEDEITIRNFKSSECVYEETKKEKEMLLATKIRSDNDNLNLHDFSNEIEINWIPIYSLNSGFNAQIKANYLRNFFHSTIRDRIQEAIPVKPHKRRRPRILSSSF